ncbi:hypothetical protein [Fibrobacter sp.]|uniref:hypothetical protein n=1 Tax=Fibrobacter sp. TaxID=35828 RepID=UPI00388FDE78
MRNIIPLEVKKTCCEMHARGVSSREIYNSYFKNEVEKPQTYESFKRALKRWQKKPMPDDITLNGGTYEGFKAHAATVQVSKTGEIVQAWIKQTASEMDMEEFVAAIRESAEPFDYDSCDRPRDGRRMLEIPLFDMHWGTAFMDYYGPVLRDILEVIESRVWDLIVIPFGQDFFHNDSIVNGQTTKGTVIEKVDMTRAVKEAKTFMYKLIDTAITHSVKVQILYSPGNHDRSISWMFMQVLLERYGDKIVDDSLSCRKVITYGKNSIMVTHGDSKNATPKTLAQIFPIAFAKEFSEANVREVHAGHLHHEVECDVHGVMVRRLSSGNRTDDWSDQEDLIGAHKRFMLFEWNLEKLKSIHYI